MKLRNSVPKANGTGTHREIPTETTYERIVPHARRVGITRVADITGLDRIGIPVYNVLCPASNDLISVYNGKGATPLDAKTSAIMEGVERFAAELPRTPDVVASYPELAESGRTVLDPREFNFDLHEHYKIEDPISWVRGYDLINETSVLVPMYLAGYYIRLHEVPCYALATTNGLASGNSLEEAICHALCELIERDDWTMADITANRLPLVLNQRVSGSTKPSAVAPWLHDRYPSIAIDSLPESAARLVRMFHDAGLNVHLKSITSATSIPSVLAVVPEDVAPTFAQSHLGMGTHPDAEVAVCRALTEAAQSRVVDINAIREDIALPDEEVDKKFWHVKRGGKVSEETWEFKSSKTNVRMQNLPNYPSEDIVTDMRLMLERLQARGLNRAIAVDLSPPEVPAKVVRVIVPGIESWILDRSKLGPRAAAEWNGTLSAIRQAYGFVSADKN